jgi:hypothetical protein
MADSPEAPGSDDVGRSTRKRNRGIERKQIGGWLADDDSPSRHTAKRALELM